MIGIENNALYNRIALDYVSAMVDYRHKTIDALAKKYYRHSSIVERDFANVMILEKDRIGSALKEAEKRPEGLSRLFAFGMTYNVQTTVVKELLERHYNKWVVPFGKTRKNH